MKGLFLFLLSYVLFNSELSFAVAPTITGFRPGSGTLGTLVTITGTNLTGANSVRIAGVAATDVTVVNSTTITAKVGARSTTNVITVTTPGGTASTLNSVLGHLGNGKFESLCTPRVDINRSLAIRDASVINHANAKGALGIWSFNFLMSQMAPAGMSTSTFIKKWIRNWRDTKLVNSRSISSNTFTPNTSSLTTFLSDWPRISSGAVEFDGTRPLDLNVDKLLLVAITFRPDLDNTSTTPSAGEGRFVFRIPRAPDLAGGNDDDSVILEYKLPIMSGTSPVSARGWALLIHDLSTITVNSSSYIAKLKAVTDKFTKKTFAGVVGMQNGSAINQVRTNTIISEGGAKWGLREFHLTPTAIAGTTISTGSIVVVGAQVGELVSSTIHNNPAEAMSFPRSLVETWVLENESAVLAGTATVTPGLLGGVTTSESSWTFSPVVRESVKKAFDMTTCKGCHNPTVNLNGNRGTANKFLQASRTGFSSFMTGTTTGSVDNPLVEVSTPMPGGFATPFTFTPAGTVTTNSGYSDLHSRAHNLLNKLVVNFCR
ncbi:MAG: IPT/TIG domain-containing protein [Bdellovibrionales bacterium]|nr:IPT/TIG domain-containing protein [Bdellovibrionales bacterium]